jgi:hypothetical protein
MFRNMLCFFWLLYFNKVLLCSDLPTLSIEICNSHTTGMNHLTIVLSKHFLLFHTDAQNYKIKEY